MNRRDFLLNEMNIVQWQLTKPQVLKGSAQIQLAQKVKLVVVCEQNWQQSGLFNDILRTLQLNVEAYQWFNFEQAQRLRIEHQPIFWLIQPQSAIDEFTRRYPHLPIWQHSTWQMLQQAAEKRRFWKQLQPFCQHFEE